MDHFELVSEYKPTGDQPEAIRELVEGFREGNQCETLLGVTAMSHIGFLPEILQPAPERHLQWQTSLHS